MTGHAEVQSAAVYGAFLMEGLRDCRCDYDELLKKADGIGMGCLELVNEIAGYIDYLAKLVDAADDHAGQIRPGVLDYEVTSPFGTWFGQYLFDHGYTPAQEECREYLRDSVSSFFSQDEAVNPHSLFAVLNGIE